MSDMSSLCKMTATIASGMAASSDSPKDIAHRAALIAKEVIEEVGRHIEKELDFLSGTPDDILRQALKLWPTSSIGEDNDGQVLIYTDLYQVKCTSCDGAGKADDKIKNICQTCFGMGFNLVQRNALGELPS